MATENLIKLENVVIKFYKVAFEERKMGSACNTTRPGTLLVKEETVLCSVYMI
jgi:hypothetical protein